MPVKVPPSVTSAMRKWGNPLQRIQPPCLQTVAALLSPFLVPWLQLLSSVPQEDVVLLLGVVVLMALRKSD